MKLKTLLAVFITITLTLLVMDSSAIPSSSSPQKPRKVLDLSHSPRVAGDSFGRSVNLSFFVPAFSLFALASQFMPQMFPTLTTTTTSRLANVNLPGRTRRHVQDSTQEGSDDGVPDWLENAIRKGLLY